MAAAGARVAGRHPSAAYVLYRATIWRSLNGATEPQSAATRLSEDLTQGIRIGGRGREDAGGAMPTLRRMARRLEFVRDQGQWTAVVIGVDSWPCTMTARQ